MSLITEGNKKSIDIMFTAIITGAVIWFFYKRNKGKFAKTEYVMIGAAMILGYIIISQITNNLITAAETPKDKEIPDDAGNTPNYDPTAVTNNLKAAIDKSGFNWDGDYMPAAYQDALNLSNGDLTVVWNDWKNRYYSMYDNKALRAAIEGVEMYWYIGNGYDSDSIRDSLVERMKSLNLE